MITQNDNYQKFMEINSTIFIHIDRIEEFSKYHLRMKIKRKKMNELTYSTDLLIPARGFIFL